MGLAYNESVKPCSQSSLQPERAPQQEELLVAHRFLTDVETIRLVLDEQDSNCDIRISPTNTGPKILRFVRVQYEGAFHRDTFSSLG
jgi:hypothetical protein